MKDQQAGRPIIGADLVGALLRDCVREWGAKWIEHVGGRRFIAHRPDGERLRMLTDEGIGSCEGEDGFQAAWRADARRRPRIAMDLLPPLRVPRGWRERLREIAEHEGIGVVSARRQALAQWMQARERREDTMRRPMRAGYREHDHMTDWQECDTCHLRIGEGIATAWDAAYHASDDPDACPRTGCDGRMGLPAQKEQR